MSDLIYGVRDFHLLTPHVAQVMLVNQSPEPLPYQAGQYFKIVHPDQSTSPFSMANDPQNPAEIELHLLFLKDNKKSWGIMEWVKAKKEVFLRGPFGTCTADRLDKNKPIIFIARGTGFSPIKAVIENLLRQPAHPPIHFYWSVPGWRDLYLQDLIHRWVDTAPNFKFTAVVTREYLPQEEKLLRFGAVQDIVLQDYSDLSQHQVYVSGPENLVYPALEAFQAKGLSKQNFYSDVFDYVP